MIMMKQKRVMKKNNNNNNNDKDIINLIDEYIESSATVKVDKEYFNEQEFSQKSIDQSIINNYDNNKKITNTTIINNFRKININFSYVNEPTVINGDNFINGYLKSSYVYQNSIQKYNMTNVLSTNISRLIYLEDFENKNSPKGDELVSELLLRAYNTYKYIAKYVAIYNVTDISTLQSSRDVVSGRSIFIGNVYHNLYLEFTNLHPEYIVDIFLEKVEYTLIDVKSIEILKKYQYIFTKKQNDTKRGIDITLEKNVLGPNNPIHNNFKKYLYRYRIFVNVDRFELGLTIKQ